MSEPTIASTDTDIAACFAVMSELRPHLAEDDFVALIRSMQGDGYQLLSLTDNQQVVAVAGFRIHTTLFMGRNLYVDDLVTAASARSRGFGETLLDWLRDRARAEQCQYLHLDSGTQRHRAHRFYLRNSLDITSFHFSQKLD